MVTQPDTRIGSVPQTDRPAGRVRVAGHLQSLPLYSVPSESAPITVVASTALRRILVGGADGHCKRSCIPATTAGARSAATR